MHTPGPWRGTCEIVGGSRVVATVSWCSGMKEEDDANARLIAAAPDLYAVLQRYMAAYPAFRIKPEGAPGSPKRVEQENLMALEDAARAITARVLGRDQQ